MAVQMYACYLTLAHIACIATQTDILAFTSHSFFISKAWVLQDLLENSCRSKEQKNVCFQTGHGMHVFETSNSRVAYEGLVPRFQHNMGFWHRSSCLCAAELYTMYIKRGCVHDDLLEMDCQ